MTFADLYKKLSQLYPENLREEWDNDGIMCSPNMYKKVERALITLDVTDEVIEYAKVNDFDTIISHHPLIFRPVSALSENNYIQAKLIKLIKYGINVMSFHTRLDAAEGGVNDTLCSCIELENVEKDSQDPIGRIGDIYEEMTLEEFSQIVSTNLESPFVLYSGNRSVRRVYVVGGDGKDFVSRAIATGCDTLVTGRCSYNVSIDAVDMGLNIVEAGHFYTENPVCMSIAEDIQIIDPEIYTQAYNSNNIKFS
ncbi:MAG: Nif3-like dinuclear metal center hexameric protein [Clostridia bacterium]|nr:Nif3-like dinuclear metal center hexameric protein [Clostridia bacterium]